MNQMADLVQKLSSELRWGLRPAYNNFMGFFHATDWKVMHPLPPSCYFCLAVEKTQEMEEILIFFCCFVRVENDFEYIDLRFIMHVCLLLIRSVVLSFRVALHVCSMLYPVLSNSSFIS
ncbi:hypothetical protein SLEP1_g43779 [Rubroshorea leprosula]|uniref:Uncharacterized protein n=1 Tax=Rubroshorea leprosula TaxID=152421 RepID=A0AAV5LEH1_9ROSI|nr:hypothetical protein SLEP1_g43779 [Rubroshorea leprosula]